MDTVIIDGRELYQATAWWFKAKEQGSLLDAQVSLFCIHGVSLDKNCGSCQANQEEHDG